jgi:hypothetical protein
MTRRELSVTAAVVALFVTAETWPTHSRYLFSWDSANFAFAISRIDIALHRPHPPGYLGYVLAGRSLAALTHESNAALILWNVLALSGAGVLMAWLGASTITGKSGAFAAAVLLVTSPLVWFYASVAEIYVSELLVTLAIACAASAALKGSVRAMHWLAAALACAAFFKLSAMALMLPVAAFAWYRGPSGGRMSSPLLLAALLAVVGAIFLTAEPHLVSVIWVHFTGATAQSRLIGGAPDIRIGPALNRNARDTFTASLAALGFVNGCGLLWWLVADRRLPQGLGWPFVALWSMPWLAEFLFVHIGKPGYILPLFPLACIILGNFYTRRGPAVLLAIVVLQVAANLAYVTLLSPSASNAETRKRYADKTLLQRMASDLQPLTFPTRATVLAADDRIDKLLALRRSVCPAGDWVIVAGVDPIDWRRVMYYVPSAQAIHVLPDGSPAFIGRNGDFRDVPESGTAIASDCGLLWIGDENLHNSPAADGRPVAGIGWLLPSGSGMVTRGAVMWTPR